MSAPEFEQLLVDFQKFATEVSNTPFDLPWHHIPGHDVEVAADSDWPDLTWPEEYKSKLPPDVEDRCGFGQVFRGLDAASPVGFGWVTLPLASAHESSSPSRNGDPLFGTFGNDPFYLIFYRLAERAGGVLPPPVKDEIVKSWPMVGTGQAQRWYALLFHLHGKPLGTGELVVKHSLWDSIDVIQRCGLNTENPVFREVGEEPGKGQSECGGKSQKVKPKRSTQRGEARLKLISALTKHHEYADGGCLNQAPIGNNKLARLAEVSPSTASKFFKQKFGGVTDYRRICWDSQRLVGALKLLNQEFSPVDLYGSVPPGDRENRE